MKTHTTPTKIASQSQSPSIPKMSIRTRNRRKRKPADMNSSKAPKLLYRSKIARQKREREQKQKQWTPRKMREAIKLVRENGFSLANAASKCTIPVSTLGFYIRTNKDPSEDTANNGLDEYESVDEDNDDDNEYDDDEEDIDDDDEDDGDDEDECSEIKIENEFVANGRVNTSLVEIEPSANGNVNGNNDMPSPTRRFLPMARKSTSPYKVYLENKQKNIQAAQIEQDLLKKFEKEKDEKPSSLVAATASLLNGKRNGHNHLKKKDLNDAKANNISTLTFIDFFIEGSKKNADAIGAVTLATIEKNDLMNDFQKAFKIYAYLAVRQRYHPVFLNRNLSYLSTKQNLHKKKRKMLKIDQICTRKQLELKARSPHKLNGFVGDHEVHFKLNSFLIRNENDRKEALKLEPAIKVELNGLKCGINQELAKLNSNQLEVRKQPNATGGVTISPINTFQLKLNMREYDEIYIKISIGSAIYSTKYSTKDKLATAAGDFTYIISSESKGKSNYTSDDPFAEFNSSNAVNFSVKQNAKYSPVKVASPKQTKTIQNRKDRLVKQESNQSSSNENVYYKFILSNADNSTSTKPINLKIMTRATFSNQYTCPFCHQSNHMRTESDLISHLTYSHARFSTKLTTMGTNGGGCIIELTIDPLYDASYSFKHEHQLNGYSTALLKPECLPAYLIKNTQVLTNKRHGFINLAKHRGHLSHEDFEALTLLMNAVNAEVAQRNENDSSNRVYYHTKTTQPILNEDTFDNDSDTEIAPDWLQENNDLLINDFDDLNEGEKKLLRVWNLHCLRHHFEVSDILVYNICVSFIEHEAHRLVQDSMLRNFILHLKNLFDYDLLTHECLLKLTDLLNQKIKAK